MKVEAQPTTTTEVPAEAPELVEPDLSDKEYASVLLELAADRIEEGWTKGNFAAFGNVCAVGAIGSVMRREKDRFPKGRRVQIRGEAEIRLARKVLPRGYYSFDPKGTIIAWNDRPGRTKQEVIRTFREVAAE